MEVKECIYSVSLVLYLNIFKSIGTHNRKEAFFLYICCQKLVFEFCC